MKSKTRTPEWLIPTALILLSVVPVIAGAARITELSTSTDITPNNARFFASPLPVMLHIISATLYSLLGAFQFAPTFRRKHLAWHRTIGRLLIPSGLVAALSGLWMTLFYPWPQYDGEILYVMRLFFGSLMTLSIVLAVIAIYQRDFTKHGAWMIRAYAIGLGAGTQVFTHIPWFLFSDVQGELARALCMGAGWVINLVIAEWVIRKQFGWQTRHVSVTV